MLELLAPAATVLALVAYLIGVASLARRGVGWPPSRAFCLVAGTLLVVVVSLPPVAGSDDLFRVDIAQHLVIAMVAPGLLALSAPVTLALRVMSVGPRRRLVRAAHSRTVALLTAPGTVVALNLGGILLLYLTPLYSLTVRNDLVHAAVHLHMFLAGCLLSWVVVGPDPVRATFGLRHRLFVLVAVAAGHDTVSKLLYARDLPHGAGSLAERHAGAELMYYGSSLVDVVVAIVVMTQWWRATGRELARARRRAAPNNAAENGDIAAA